MKKACPYGTHRVLEPKGVLPQQAQRLDNTMTIYDNEILLDVETLNIDSASFTQISEQAQGNLDELAKIMRGIVDERGKHHNPVTGSGGMFIGQIAQIGPKFPRTDLKVGDRIASLVSLSLTPLTIKEIKKIHRDIAQVDIDGQAILFASSIFAKLPQDLPDTLSLAVLDVAGAPAQTARFVKSGDTVLVIGAGGKSGLLCLHEAKKRAGVTGRVIAFEYSAESLERVKHLGLADEIIQGDAKKPLETMEKISQVTKGELADVTINCVNIPSTEMASILSTKERGTIYFFSMATSFTAAALGAEGVGRDVDMYVGNGYTKGHAQIALAALRENEKLKKIFQEIFAAG